MNQELWNKIATFDFDNPPSLYGFSTRLANENCWTKEFTDQAILEYKKFMYLAATSDFMVSPSEIVDIVWHQHLIFSQSYQALCDLLGKQIQHIPSTHNKEDFEKFKQAKERTLKFYERDFGQQPKNIWSYSDILGSLNLEKAKLTLTTFIIIGISSFICLTVPAFYLLKPIYTKINNPYFLIGFIFLTITTLLILEFYNISKLKEVVTQIDPSSFINNLQPYELVYLKTQKLPNVINGVVNELIENGSIYVNPNSSIELADSPQPTDVAQLQVCSTLRELGNTFYPILLRYLVTKPIFVNIENSMDAFRKHVNKSKKFGALFYTNFIVLALLLLLSLTRIVTGVMREKPVALILMMTVALMIAAIVFLERLTKQMATKTIPDLYKNEILPTREIDDNWQWTYFLLGYTTFTTAFIPLANYVARNNDDSRNCGTSCGNSGGGGCGGGGSSCGGGGGCGGCGGCGGD